MFLSIIRSVFALTSRTMPPTTRRCCGGTSLFVSRAQHATKGAARTRGFPEAPGRHVIDPWSTSPAMEGIAVHRRGAFYPWCAARAQYHVSTTGGSLASAIVRLLPSMDTSVPMKFTFRPRRGAAPVAPRETHRAAHQARAV